MVALLTGSSAGEGMRAACGRSHTLAGRVVGVLAGGSAARQHPTQLKI